MERKRESCNRREERVRGDALLRYCWMNWPPGREERDRTGWMEGGRLKKMNMTETQKKKKEGGGARIKGGREKKTWKGDDGRRKENGRRGGQTGHVKGFLCPRHAWGKAKNTANTVWTPCPPRVCVCVCVCVCFCVLRITFLRGEDLGLTSGGSSPHPSAQSLHTPPTDTHILTPPQMLTRYSNICIHTHTHTHTHTHKKNLAPPRHPRTPPGSFSVS